VPRLVARERGEPVEAGEPVADPRGAAPRARARDDVVPGDEDADVARAELADPLPSQPAQAIAAAQQQTVVLNGELERR